MFKAPEIPADADRAAVYRDLLPSLRAVVDGEPDLVANLANLAALLYHAIPGVTWVGFYRTVGEDLVLGPFQGKVACTRIGPGRGVCGAAAARAEVVVVPDVEAFPGHIACDSATRSEIVAPVVRDGRVVAVLDLDSDRPAWFGEVDAEHLAQVAALAATLAW